MKRITAALLALMLLLSILSGCGGSKSAAQAPAETALPEATAEPTPEPTPDQTVALLQLGKDELEIRIGDLQLDEDGTLTVFVEGITLKNYWRALKMEVMVDGERYFLETSHVTNDSYSRTSLRYFEKLPEQVILYSEGNEQNPLIYDVADGVFVS